MEEQDRQAAFYPEKILDNTPETDAVETYVRELLKLEAQLISLEARATQTTLGPTGYRASRELAKLESKHRSCVNCLNDAQIAAHRETLEPVDLNVDERETEFTQLAGDGAFDDQLERLDRLVERTGRRLASRRNSANARMTLTISIVALVVAILSFVFRYL